MSMIPMAKEDVKMAEKALELARARAKSAKDALEGVRGASLMFRVGVEIDASRDAVRCERLLFAAKVGADRGGVWDADDYGFLARMAGK